MRARTIAFAITTIFASVASGQTSSQSLDRVFHFANTGTPQGFQAVASAIRSIGNIQQVTVDAEQKTLAVHGIASQVSLAEWLFNDLDKAAGGPSPISPSAAQEYRMPAGSDDVVRVFYLTQIGTPQAMQEIVNAIRSTVEIQRAVVCNGPRALVLRGTVEQLAAAEWLVSALDKPAGGPPQAPQGQGPAKLEYRLSGPQNPAMRVFYLAHTPTPQGAQEIVNTIRSIAEIQRLVVYNGLSALVMRGTAEQAALAEWLVNQLDRPAGTQPPALASQNAATNEYHLIGSGDVMRVFFLTHIKAPQDSQAIVSLIRSTLKIQRAVTCSGPGAIALRGTPVQVAQAEQLIQERDK